MKTVKPKNFVFEFTRKNCVSPCIGIFNHGKQIDVIFVIFWFAFGLRIPRKPKDAVPAKGIISNTGRASLVAVEDENFKREYLPLGNPISYGDVIYTLNPVEHILAGTKLIVLSVHNDDTLYVQLQTLDDKYRFVINRSDVCQFRDNQYVKGYIQDNAYFVTHIIENKQRSASPDKVLMN